jgi:uncharacterized protein (TIGR03790 family)
MSKRMSLGRFCLGLLLFFGISFWSAPVASQEPLNRRVLVVYNSGMRESGDVAKYYVQRRAIPKSNLCRISPPTAARLNWDQYVTWVRNPIQKCLKSVGPANILYIVFAYQTPYTVKGIDNPLNYAIDSYVADIWDEYAKTDFYPMPTKLQPYYDDAKSRRNIYQPFESFADYRAKPSALLIYSVWRMDGPTVALAKGLVDKAIAAEASGLTGRACFDRNKGPIEKVSDSGYGEGEWDLHQAATFAREAGLEVIEDSNFAEFGTPPAPECPNAALYSGWYKLGRYNDAFMWNTGAIGFHLDSFSALNPRGGTNWSANAIIRGITVTSGSVTEPYLQGLLRPGGTFRDLFQGANVGDAFLRNTRWLRWMTLYFGDPLYRPFPKKVPPFSGPPKSP